MLRHRGWLWVAFAGLLLGVLSLYLAARWGHGMSLGPSRTWANGTVEQGPRTEWEAPWYRPALWGGGGLALLALLVLGAHLRARRAQAS